METQKIKKVNPLYLLGNIFIPIMAIVLGIVLVVVIPPLHENSGVGAIVLTVIFFGSIIWWAIGTGKMYEKKRDAKLKELDGKGFVRNHTFNADGCTVAVDMVHGNIAIVFKWNPSQCFVVPANRVSKMWVDDGKTPMGGTSRVSFLFIVDDTKIRVNTFTSNKIWNMKSNYVLEALSKADMMIEALKKAYAVAQGNAGANMQ